jgi:hypothetical protein
MHNADTILTSTLANRIPRGALAPILAGLTMDSLAQTNHSLIRSARSIQMNTQKLAQDFAKAINAGDWDTVASYLADDFQFSGPVPEPVSGAEWIGLNQTMQAGMPDMSINLRIVSVEGDEIRSVDQVTGTHTSDLDLTPQGIGVIPASGKRLSLPQETGVARVRDGKLVSIHLNTPENGGLAGLLAQLGVEPPPM